jgi:hypothetical protein
MKIFFNTDVIKYQDFKNNNANGNGFALNKNKPFNGFFFKIVLDK